MVAALTVGLLAGCTATERVDGTAKPEPSGRPPTPSISANADATPAGDAGVYAERPGYQRDDGIGDPAAVVFIAAEPPAPAVSIAGSAVVQACSVVTPQDVRAAGAVTFPGLSSVSRAMFDGQGTLPVEVDKHGLPWAEETNSCEMRLGSDRAERGHVDVVVAQPGYADATVIGREHESPHMTVAPAVDGAPGVSVWRRTLPAHTSRDQVWWLRAGDVGVQLEVAWGDTRAAGKILEAAARNVRRLVTTPEGPPLLTYDSPVLDAAAAMPCTVFTAKDFARLFASSGSGGASSVLAKEHLDSFVSVVDYSGFAEPADTTGEPRGGSGGRAGEGSASSGGRVNFTTALCERRSAWGFAPDADGAQVEVSSFETVDGARRHVAFLRSAYATIGDGPPRVGDEALYMRERLDAEELIVRQGRFVLDMTVPGSLVSALPAPQRLTRLVDTVRGMLGQLPAR